MAFFLAFFQGLLTQKHDVGCHCLYQKKLCCDLVTYCRQIFLIEDVSTISSDGMKMLMMLENIVRFRVT
jgi:hypothetical protein